MKKTLMIAAAAAFMLSGFAVTEAVAGFKVSSCKSCHKVDKKSMGPKWKDVAAAYGDAATLQKVFEDGFKPADRKYLAANPGTKSVKMMTGKFKKLIKGHEKEAADALFAAVKAGKI